MLLFFLLILMQSLGSKLPTSPFHQRVLDLIDISEHPNLRFLEGFVTSINFQRKVPNIVIEELDLRDHEVLVEMADRSRCKFRTFANNSYVPVKFEARLDDYQGSGYARGHLAAAANFKLVSQSAMAESFILAANIVPQNMKHNSGFWAKLEQFARSQLLSAFGSLFVLTGHCF
jgi:DNA/RNA endonuclease G (NUC1)